MKEDTLIKEIQSLKNQVYNQNEELEILNKRIDQILDTINDNELNKHVNLI